MIEDHIDNDNISKNNDYGDDYDNDHNSLHYIRLIFLYIFFSKNMKIMKLLKAELKFLLDTLVSFSSKSRKNVW